MNTSPKKIALHKKRAELELQYADSNYILSAEFLRVHSPSAEVQGHGPGQKNLPLNKQNVQITGIEQQGNYAIKLIFDDGHDSGIYSWSYLQKLGQEKDALWEQYLKDAEQEKLKQQQTQDVQPIKWL